MGVLEACDVGEHLCVRKLCDHVLLDLAAAAVALEEQLALALTGKEEPHDVAGIDDDVVRGFLFVSSLVVEHRLDGSAALPQAHGLRAVTNCWSFW